MLTLSFGFKKPETGDTGSVIFPALEGNIQQLNDHNHDGANSSKISSSAISPLTSTALSASWVLVGNGIYSQTITMPAALAYDTTTFQVRLTSSGHLVYPRIDKVSASQYTIFTNDNTADFTIHYL